MKQSRAMSLVETTFSTAIGFAIAFSAQLVIFPLFGFRPPLTDNLLITFAFTAVSIARQFLLRRLFEALHIRRPLSPALQAIIAERCRQIDVEGWSREHDDCHERGELASAAACYALCAGDEKREPRSEWPWSYTWWKPRDFRRDLVRAGALIVAEIDKFDRQRKVRR